MTDRLEIKKYEGYFVISRSGITREVTIDSPYRIQGTDILKSKFTVLVWPRGLGGGLIGETTCSSLDEAIEIGVKAFNKDIELPKPRVLSANDFLSTDFYFTGVRERGRTCLS